MARINIIVPENFHYSTRLPVRITDLNYGNHLGNDALIALIHEARVSYLASIGYSELDFAGVSLIMRDLAVQYKAEVFYGTVLEIFVRADDFSSSGFNLFYKVVDQKNSKVSALVQTGMVCFDYDQRKPVRLPEEAKQRLENA